MTLQILVSRHAAFYSPLIATIAHGFLRDEGLDATYGVLKPGQTTRDALHSGEAHLTQSAVSSNWGPRDKGIGGLPFHFAQINCRDGFFLLARKTSAEPFSFSQLEGKSLIADHGGQPLPMLKFALKHNGVDWNKITAIDAGSPQEMVDAFRKGTGDYIHLQGPVPQQLQLEGLGEVVVSVGASMPEVAFSSICALPGFLETPECAAFLRAFAKAKRWVQQSPAAEVAEAEAAYFPEIRREALAQSIASYQKVGCWLGGIAISKPLYEQSLRVFGLSDAAHPYEEVVRLPGNPNLL